MSLALDTTGVAVANRINGETILVSPSTLNTFGCVFPADAPFFGSDFSLHYTPSDPDEEEKTMVLGTDFNFDFELPGFGGDAEDPQDPTKKVWGAIVIFDQGLDGTLTVEYQSLGGKWTFDIQAIRNYLNSHMFNSSFEFKALVPKDPLFLPNNPNAVWPLNSINSITIAQAQMPSGIVLSVEFLRKDGTAVDSVAQVVVLDLPLPPDAARESGNLKTIADAQGQAANGINQLTGGVGILGWLSAIYANAVNLLAKLTSIDTKLGASVKVDQNGLWNVGLNAGTNTIGSVYPAALASIVDYSSTPGYVYICEALPGTVAGVAGWRISKMDLSTGSVQWADGDGNFDNIASSRDMLDYS